MASIAWTPEHSQMGIGTILLPRQPTSPLTTDQYRLLMAAKIERLIKKETPEAARYYLGMVEVMEPLSVIDNLETAGLILAENSEMLNEKTGWTGQPIPADQIKNDRTSRLAMKGMDLETFLSRVYRI